VTLSPSHTSFVTSLAFSSDHSYLASCSDDGFVNLWSSNSSWSLTLHLNNLASCNAILQLENGQIAASSFNKTLIWGVFNITNPIKALVYHSSAVTALALSPDRSLLASGGAGNTIVLWNYKTQSSYWKALNNHTGQVRALVFISNQILASGSLDLSIKTWSVSSGKLFLFYKGSSS
jgi:WD40 repeat protein